jgi:hypothetical protein
MFTNFLYGFVLHSSAHAIMSELTGSLFGETTGANVCFCVYAYAYACDYACACVILIVFVIDKFTCVYYCVVANMVAS